MKKCFRCGIEKPLDQFYAHKQMADGHLNKCAECTKADTKQRAEKLMTNPDFVESEKARHRDKYYRLGYKEKHKPTPERRSVAMNLHRERYPEKYKARNACAKIKRPDGMEAHHWSYRPEHAKDLIFLTQVEHARLHRFIVYDQERMMYRRSDNNMLLDSREIHEWYLGFIS
jgi:hypothetical protein